MRNQYRNDRQQALSGRMELDTVPMVDMRPAPMRGKRSDGIAWGKVAAIISAALVVGFVLLWAFSKASGGH